MKVKVDFYLGFGGNYDTVSTTIDTEDYLDLTDEDYCNELFEEEIRKQIHIHIDGFEKIESEE